MEAIQFAAYTLAFYIE